MATPPDPDSDLVLERDVRLFEGLCAGVFSLLGSLARNKEEIRYRIASQKHLVSSLDKALHSQDRQLHMAALRYSVYSSASGGRDLNP